MLLYYCMFKHKSEKKFFKFRATIYYCTIYTLYNYRWPFPFIESRDFFVYL